MERRRSSVPVDLGAESRPHILRLRRAENMTQLGRSIVAIASSIPLEPIRQPNGTILYENVSISMRNTGRVELKDAERPKKLVDMMADLEKKGAVNAQPLETV